MFSGDALSVAKAAALWWTDVLARQVPPSLARDAGWVRPESEARDVERAMFGDMMTHMILDKAPPVTPEHVATFYAVLVYAIEAAMLKQCGDDGAWPMTVSTDYAPCRLLAEALELAKVPGPLDLRLPYKTCMWVGPYHLKVKTGYGAGHGLLYQSKADAITWALADRGGRGEEVDRDVVRTRRNEVSKRLFEADIIHGPFDELVFRLDAYITGGGTFPLPIMEVPREGDV